ncbi:phosphate transporter subunit; periplasmic-binding component of ABC superfamily [Thiomonas arsenitoxydans]|jgi:phosphate transport system substrate-binding protein|uniref:Phosphate-binding protein PstS n=1 Tax=Thiomonas arsenitoxydans (strain DSM 22701 / CIP 110005 / 3As) TaxID=426114 RepID=D6CU27_THIA3|nr:MULTISPECIES: phosphate ABC transporter substrate-binding protein PstS [Thiomonas]OYV31675.1 MAG: phosphate ABC transporter substrate-binding protein PstS [Thiomonas sp. 20-64-9]CQR41288.1 phosphate transporter subunit; periplasmic-binding component of ABC superfamily [Thiomonas sp. CB3]OZB72353.1 MAG: phosphate ABC transporter substrate-binding protein PstS [Thiomonas sp. 13-64-67]CAZ88796.1 Phosphate-binding periplasmic protein precursor (PBP) [Thiomonas arsenitoxydans]CQR26329.1 phosphat
MNWNRRSFGKAALAIAVSGALSTGIMTTAFAATSLTGAGSTWVYPLVVKWSVVYEKETGTKVNYQGIGSGGGIAQIKAGTVAFGASDMPLKPEELEKDGLIQFPTAVAGEDLVYNLPGIKPGELILSGPVVADIYLGKIKKWNDPAIEKLNPGLKLPSMDITVVHRSDGSGTTFTFADYLSKVSPEWKQKVGANTSLNWPTGVGGKGNEGVAAYVQRISGSIGYVEYAYILENKMSYARMINRDGKVVSPSLKGFQDAAAHVDFNKAQDFYVILTDHTGPDTWPISGCTWQILSKKAPKATNEEVTKFFTWGFEHGQKMAESIAFGPLPTSTVDVIKTYWKKNLGI